MITLINGFPYFIPSGWFTYQDYVDKKGLVSYAIWEKIRNRCIMRINSEGTREYHIK